MSGAECVFCAILAGRAPASVVHADERVVAFMDLRQAVSGHVLVVPRAHVPRLHLLEADDAAALMQVAVRLAGALERAFAPPGLNLWQSNGEAGGQEVDHVHLHLQPRRVDDGIFEVYPNGVPAPTAITALEALATRVRAALG